MVCVDLVEHVAVLVVVWVRILLLLLLLLLFMMVLLHKLIVLLLPGNDPLFFAGGGSGRSSGGLSRVGRPADDRGGLGPERVAVVLGERHLEEGVGVAHELVDVPLPCKDDDKLSLTVVEGRKLRMAGT